MGNFDSGEYIKDYEKKTYSKILVRFRKDDGTKKRIEQAAKIRGISQSEYIRLAVTQQLEKEGL